MLKEIIRTMVGRQENTHEIIVPLRKCYPIIGAITDVITIDSNNVALKNELEQRVYARKNNQEKSG